MNYSIHVIKYFMEFMLVHLKKIIVHCNQFASALSCLVNCDFYLNIFLSCLLCLLGLDINIIIFNATDEFSYSFILSQTKYNILNKCNDVRHPLNINSNSFAQGGRGMTYCMVMDGLYVWPDRHILYQDNVMGILQ